MDIPMKKTLRMLSLAIAIAIAGATPNTTRAADAFGSLGGALVRGAVIRELMTVAQSGPAIVEINLDGGLRVSAVRVTTYGDPKHVIVVAHVRDPNKMLVALVELDLYDGEFVSFRPLTPESAAWTHMGNSSATGGSGDSGGGDSM